MSSKSKNTFGAIKKHFMKTLLMAIAVSTTMSCFAQKDIPAVVQEAFKKNFPGVTVKKWDKEDGNFEANFSKDGKTMSATFDAKGKWLETETDIEVKDLPASIVSYIKAHYNNAAIKEAAMLKTPAGDKYEAEVKGVKKDLLFDANGNFLKEEKKLTDHFEELCLLYKITFSLICWFTVRSAKFVGAIACSQDIS